MEESTTLAAPARSLRRMILRCGIVIGFSAIAWLLGSMSSTAAAKPAPPPAPFGGLLQDVTGSVTGLVNDVLAVPGAHDRSHSGGDGGDVNRSAAVDQPYGLVADVVGAATPIVDDLVAVAVPVADRVVDTAAPVADTVSHVVDQVGRAAKPAVNTLAPVVDGVTDAVSPVTHGLAPVVGDVAGIGTQVTQAIAPTVNTVAGAATPITQAIAPIVNDVSRITEPLLGAVADAAAPLTKSVNPVLGVVGEITTPVTGAVSPIIAGLSPLLDPLQPALSSLLNGPDDGKVPPPNTDGDGDSLGDVSSGCVSSIFSATSRCGVSGDASQSNAAPGGDMTSDYKNPVQIVNLGFQPRPSSSTVAGSSPSVNLAALRVLSPGKAMIPRPVGDASATDTDSSGSALRDVSPEPPTAAATSWSRSPSGSNDAGLPGFPPPSGHGPEAVVPAGSASTASGGGGGFQAATGSCASAADFSSTTVVSAVDSTISSFYIADPSFSPD